MTPKDAHKQALNAAAAPKLRRKLKKQIAEIERLRTALGAIASCDQNVEGDVVDIARKALRS